MFTIMRRPDNEPCPKGPGFRRPDENQLPAQIYSVPCHLYEGPYIPPLSLPLMLATQQKTRGVVESVLRGLRPLRIIHDYPQLQP
ncbi:MAG: hypothetical protein KGJ02_04005 [Verrucomicrobiota bacterium]|nr:hypothetical protein [Verrucomicrobiota bacterium]